MSSLPSTHGGTCFGFIGSPDQIERSTALRSPLRQPLSTRTPVRELSHPLISYQKNSALHGRPQPPSEPANKYETNQIHLRRSPYLQPKPGSCQNLNTVHSQSRVLGTDGTAGQPQRSGVQPRPTKSIGWPESRVRLPSNPPPPKPRATNKCTHCARTLLPEARGANEG